jgi:hypothetical protein
MTTKREDVYDARIAPLMEQIISVCKEHNIPMVFSAQLNDDRAGLTDADEEGNEIGPFFCTTLLAGRTGEFANTHQRLMDAVEILRPRRASFAAYAVGGGLAERTNGSADGWDPGVPGTVRGKVTS